MNGLWRDALRAVDRMGPNEWVLVAGGLILFGFFCLRGFGSRSNY